MLATRICIILVIMLQLFLLVVAAIHRSPHVSVGSGGADRRRTSAGDVVGDNKDMEKLILWRRKMVAAGPHKSPSSPHYFRHQRRRLLGIPSEREGRPPSPATKNSGWDGSSEDVAMTKKMKEVIRCSGGKHNDDEYGVVDGRCRRWRRRLIAAGPSDSQPSPGYHRL